MKRAFIFNKNRIFAPVRVGQLDGYAYIDTGTRVSSILQSYAYPYQPVTPRTFEGGFATATVAQVRLNEVYFLGEAFGDLVVDVQPDSVGGLGALPFRVVMALGCDVLLRKPLFLNFMSHEMTYLNDNGAVTDAIVYLETDFSLDLPLFEIMLGCHRLKAVFDTGTAMCLLNRSQFASLHEEACVDEMVKVVDNTGAEYLLSTYKCRSLCLSGWSLGKCQFVLSDLSPLEAKVGLPVDFVFGVNAIKRRCWVMKSQRGFIEIR